VVGSVKSSHAPRSAGRQCAPVSSSIVIGAPETVDLPTICAFTAMCPGGTFNPTSPLADIHPTTLGYGVMAGVVGVDFFTH